MVSSDICVLQVGVGKARGVGGSADGLANQRELINAADSLRWGSARHLRDFVDLFQACGFEPVGQTAVCRNINANEFIGHLGH
ncbi:hypothetical protein D3C75_1337840 [compost metagenome]